ncbi:ATP-dependent nuclease [Pseudonocardia sp. CA-142604]|uniref:ATP-dependent nuclease n=1 Tax=Pseudonocardia sp. CA-142604 TaxID=3240024 RepID=UPI003D8B8EDF
MVSVMPVSGRHAGLHVGHEARSNTPWGLLDLIRWQLKPDPWSPTLVHIERIILDGFRCFGDKTEITLNKSLTAFVGANGTGKTAAMQALLRVFGNNSKLREIRRSDFYSSPTSNSARTPGTTRKLTIEVHLAFPELADGNGGKATVPAFYNQISCAHDGRVACRIRLEADLLEDGDQGQIDSKLHAITTFTQEIPEDARIPIGAADRSFIQVVYVPASRDAITQVDALLRGRLWRAIKWSDEVKTTLESTGKTLNDAFGKETGVSAFVTAMGTRWKQVHAANTDSTLSVQPLDVRLDQFVRNVGFHFQPNEEGGSREVAELSDGQRSLFHLAVTAATIDIEHKIATSPNSGFNTALLPLPALTVVAVEEPENNLSPFYLSRIVDQLQDLTTRTSAQALISSHSASVISRIDPKQVRHFRLESPQRALVRQIPIPDEPGEASKFVREAVMTYPELYFATFVVLGEGSSEEVVLPRLGQAMGVSIDRSFIAIVPLGGRHVKHLWKLLNALGIPHATLLDLDLGRFGAGSGRVRNVVDELINNGMRAEDIYQPGLLSQAALAATAPTEAGYRALLEAWLLHLRKFNVFFSAPLDLDMSMLTAFHDEYASVEGRGPSTQGDAKEAVLGKGYEGRGAHDDLDYPMYRYLFLGRGKPVTHVRTLVRMDDSRIAAAAPEELRALINTIIKRASLPAKVSKPAGDE